MNSTGNKKMKCLLIHGFGGGLHEVESLAGNLTGTGYEVSCPMLKGHSATKKDLRESTYKDWIDSAEQELLRMCKTGDEIVLIGFSMGGLIAFNLACKYRVSAIVTINTPIFFWNIYQVFINLMDDIKNKKYKHIRRYLQAKNNAPFLAIIQFLLLLYRTKQNLEQVNCPVLIIQAEDDDTVRIKSVDYISRHLSSGSKTIKYFHEGGHFLLQSPAATEVILCIEDFLQGPKTNRVI